MSSCVRKWKYEVFVFETWIKISRIFLSKKMTSAKLHDLLFISNYSIRKSIQIWKRFKQLFYWCTNKQLECNVNNILNNFYFSFVLNSEGIITVHVTGLRLIRKRNIRFKKNWIDVIRNLVLLRCFRTLLDHTKRCRYRYENSFS